MADQDELFYLQPGFDLSSLTVPRLRSILVAHDINYPSSAKKLDLVNIVEQHLLPQARKLLRDRDRVRRTSRGITDVPSSQESNLDDEADEREEMPPPPPKTPRGRKSKSDLAQGVEPTPRTKGRSKTPSTRRTTTKTRLSEPLTEPELQTAVASTKKVRKTAAAEPLVAQTPATHSRVSRKSRDTEESPFTQDNPFQQSSSPPSDFKTMGTASRSRKSVGTSSTRKSASRRRTRSPNEVKREEFEIPVSHLGTSADGIETTEEFTEDARLELSRDMQADRKIAKARSSALAKHKRRPTSSTAKAAPWTILGIIATAVAGWYRQEKVAVGYCGIGQPEWSLSQVENIPAWVNELGPQCEPCPSHATCYADMKVECDHDFVLREHPLGLYGVVPIPPTCEPDSAKEKKIEAVTRKAIHELRENTAEYECGTTSSSTEKQAGSTIVSPPKLGLSEEELKEKVSTQRRKGMTEEEFEDLWGSALGAIKARDEVNVKQDRSGKTIFSSTSFANLPFSCAIRRSAIRTLAANRVPILILMALSSAAFYGRRRFISYRMAQSQTPSLVAVALDRLATQAALREDGRVDEAFISVGQLRDDVLRDIFDRFERERVWDRVKNIVESNSNVRASTREGGKTGEWSRVWEWIGPINFAPGLEGRRSGGMVENSPTAVSANNGVVEAQGRNWDEGRVIY